MFKKLKRWIIKKLGGYTEPMPIHNVQFVRQEFKPVVLKAKCIQPYFEKDIPEEIYIKNELLPKLAEGITPFVTFTKEENLNICGIVHCAEIKILSEQGAGG